MKTTTFVLLSGAPALIAIVFSVPGLAAQRSAGPGAKQLVPANPLQLPAPAQPIPYNHKTHLALGLQCRRCHTNPDPGRLMTFPATSTCMSCHKTIARGKPAIRKLAALADSQQPVAWVRVYSVRAGVNWSHRAHLTAGIDCVACHGRDHQHDHNVCLRGLPPEEQR